MARPVKEGLDYISMDVDIFDDPKIMFVCERFGEKGELITVKLLLWIYKNGYYTEWSDDVALLFANRRFKNVSFELVKDVVQELLKRGFFDEAIYKRFGILTSRGIQKRWAKVSKDAKRKVEIRKEYDLLIPIIPEETPVIPEETPPKGEETPAKPEESTQSKVKYSKEKERIELLKAEQATLKQLQDEYNKLEKTKGSIVKFIREKKPKFILPFVELWNLFADERKKPHVKTVTDSRLRKFNVRITEEPFDFMAILGKAKNSEFLMTKSFFSFDWILENQDNYLQILEGKYDNDQSKKKEATKDQEKELMKSYGL